MNSWIETEALINRMASSRTPFLFAFDFGGHESFAIPLSHVNPDQLLYSMAGFTNASEAQDQHRSPVFFDRDTLDRHLYQSSFNLVMHHLNRGDSYLLNLTFPVAIRTNLDTKEIFHRAIAPFKLWVRDRFVVFSPESFISISDNCIHTFPMKGTISASIADARQTLLNNKKELAEHFTIVDLLRNDLSMVAQRVRVERFRYVDTIHTLSGKLLQTSSHIMGILPDHWHRQLGSLLLKLLPAGSISGAPKKRTIEIIREAEADERGFYTGVMGLFDGQALHSAVMIRFIEQKGDELFFRAGGGITVNSHCEEEYEELLQKVALPFAKQSILP